MRKSFIFNCDWQEVLMEYPAEVRLEVYDAIIEYVASGRLSELKPLAKMAFSFIRKEIDSNNAKYEDTVRKRSEAGKKGMASRYGSRVTVGGDSCADKKDDNSSESNDSLTNDNKANKPNKRQQKQQMITKLTNLTDNVYEDDYDNDIKENSSDEEKKKTPPSSIVFLDEEIEILKKDKVWQESLCMLHRSDVNTILSRLDDFRIYCKGSGKDFHTDIADAKSHFNHWLFKQPSLKKSDSAGGFVVETYDERREKEIQKEADERNRVLGIYQMALEKPGSRYVAIVREWGKNGTLDKYGLKPIEDDD